MLDLSKPLPNVDGLVLFGDHEQPDLVYYLPDEIELNSDGGEPDLLLQVFFPEEAVRGGLERLDSSVGALLSLGVRCGTSKTRLEKARKQVAAQLNCAGVRLVAPAWEDGRVDLLLLDDATAENATAMSDRMVRTVVGSRRPSIQDGSLSALFHARLDRRGTALVSAALRGEVGTIAGVLYELQFSALRPTVDLRMTADLNRCAQYISAGASVQYAYVGADIHAMFGTMKEQGIINVELTSLSSDPEMERLVNQAVNDFYDVLMRELFKPSVSAAELSGAGTAGVPNSALVRFSFSYTRLESHRTVEVDYRKRAATRRVHNPQAHLRQLADLRGGFERIIQRVPLSMAWREYQVTVTVPGAFDDPALLQVRVVIWRGRDAALPPELSREGGLRMSPSTVALADVAFTKSEVQPCLLSWVNEPQEPPSYQWQARGTYAPTPGIDSPSEVWSEVHVSTSADLDLFPSLLAPLHRVVLTLGAGHDESLTSVEAIVIARDQAGVQLGRRSLLVASTKSEEAWALRVSEGQTVRMEATLHYRYQGGRTLTLPAQAVLSPELVANSPFVGAVALRPLVAGAAADILEVDFVVRYADPLTGYRHEHITSMLPPDFRAEEVRIPILHLGQQVEWEAIALRERANPLSVAGGKSGGGTVVVRPSATVRRVVFEWVGPTPAELGLTFVKVSALIKDADGKQGEVKFVDFRGSNVSAPKELVLPLEAQVVWTIERRALDGSTTGKEPLAVDGDHVLITG